VGHHRKAGPGIGLHGIALARYHRRTGPGAGHMGEQGQEVELPSAFSTGAYQALGMQEAEQSTQRCAPLIELTPCTQGSYSHDP
jgi:hypothetical protein